jgi:MFS family permease
VDRTKLAFVQIISYSALFVKPLISIYFDKREKTHFSIRLFLIICSTIVTISLIALLISLPLLLLFGILLGINFAFTSMLDVITDKVLIKKSDNEQQKNKNVLWVRLGAVLGAVTTPVLAMIFSWPLFFFSCVTATIPLIIIVAFVGKPEYEEDTTPLSKEALSTDYSLKNIALLCIFAFLLYSDAIYEYPLEPFLVDYMGEGLFSLLLLGFIIINAIGIVIAGLYSHRFDRKKILIYNIIIVGIVLCLAPFTPFIIFVILYGVLQIVSGFVTINLTSLMIDVSKEKVTIFQIIAAFTVLAKVILIPLGTYLSSVLTTDWILFMAGGFFILALIPILLIKIEP